MSLDNVYKKRLTGIQSSPKNWVVTGVAGFIGSHICEALLRCDQRVVGVDNFITGHRKNLIDVKGRVSSAQWSNFEFIEGDIRDKSVCEKAVRGAEYVIHQAALGSVPRSIEDPFSSHEHNVDGFVRMILASKDSGVKKFVYASSSSVYGDHPGLPKQENEVGVPQSPYAVTKKINEIYAKNFSLIYGLDTIGLRYFNVFGQRQDPDGPYAAVIPKWIDALISGKQVEIYGDGETSRDFCFIDNVVQANILAATTENGEAINQVYNVAVDGQLSLTELFVCLKDNLSVKFPNVANAEAKYLDFRKGDIRHSRANITKAKELLGYSPTHTVHQGLGEYVKSFSESNDRSQSISDSDLRT